MTDITMCTSLRPDAQCPMREQCYRYKATPDEFRQSFFTEAPFIFAQGDHVMCEYFRPVDQPRAGHE